VTDSLAMPKKRLAFCPKCAWRQWTVLPAVALLAHQQNDCPFKDTLKEKHAEEKTT
jgi:hypothetical protein